jgi:hypothetical protein
MPFAKVLQCANRERHPFKIGQELILPDVNVLLYAVNETGPHFEKANAVLTEAFEGSGVALSTLAVMGFLRA